MKIENFDLLGSHPFGTGGRRSRRILAGYTRESVWTNNKALLNMALFAVAFIYGLAFSVFGTYVLMQLLAPLVVLIGFIIWLLPSSGRAPVGLLNKLFFAFVATVVCWPNYLALALPGMPWITMIRLVAVPLAVVMLISLSTSAPFRTLLKDIVASSPVVWKCLGAFTLIAFLSVGVSRDFAMSLNKFIVAQLYWTLIFFSACYCFARPGSAFRFVYVLWFGMLVVTLLAVQEWRHSIVPWAGRVPSFLKVDDPAIQRILSGEGVRKATGIYRVKSVFTTPLGLAEYLALFTPFLIHIAVSFKKVVIRASAVFSIALTFFVISKTDSRLGVVGFFLSFLVYFLAWGVLRWRNHKSVAGQFIVITYPAVFCGFIAASFFVRRLRVMMWGGGAQQASSEARKAQVAKGIPQILSHPWGYGIGQGADTLHFANQAGTFSIDTYYLLVGLEYGVIGFIVYYGMFVAGIAVGIKAMINAKSAESQLLVPLVISLSIFLIIKSVFSQESNHPIVFAMLGAVVALAYRTRQERALPYVS